MYTAGHDGPIIIITVIFIALDLADKGEHTALCSKTVCIKTSKIIVL